MAEHDQEKLRLLRDIIDVAARAARAADATERDCAFEECRDAVDWTHSVIERLEIAGMADELDDLVDSAYYYCEDAGVTDDDAVSWTGSGWASSPDAPSRGT